MEPLFMQGRWLAPEQLDWIREVMAAHGTWGRFRLSVHIAEHWDWRNGAGQLKDMAARTLLRKLEARGLIQLPPRTRGGGGSKPARAPRSEAGQTQSPLPVEAELGPLRPLEVQPVQSRADRRELAGLLAAHHYLGYRRPVGENVCYLARGRCGRPLGCLVFGAAAWKCAGRDQFIGWSPWARQHHLHRLANNMRFVVLPWVRVRSLASHLLSLATGRLSGDWQAKYGHGLDLVESFVQRDRFTGTCYRAANWMSVGWTQGRSRNDRARHFPVPVKEVFVYPLRSDFRQVLQTQPPNASPEPNPTPR
jgi:hypothetical protein